MSTLPPGVFHGSIIIHPNVDLRLSARIIDGFEIQAAGVGRLTATTNKPDAWNSFIGPQFLQSLETLSWDVLWECLIAVQFEPGSTVAPLPPRAIQNAASVAKAITAGYAQRI